VNSWLLQKLERWKALALTKRRGRFLASRRFRVFGRESGMGVDSCLSILRDLGTGYHRGGLGLFYLDLKMCTCRA
jgi:hypothetical protein